MSEETNAAAPQIEGWIAFTLPSGRTARRMAKPKLRHMIQAQRLAGGDKDRIGAALAAVTVIVDGQTLTLEDVEELDLADGVAVMAAASTPLGKADDSSPANIERSSS